MIPKFRIFDKQKKQMVESAWWEFYFEDERLLTVTSDLDVSYYDDELGERWELIQSTGLHDVNGKEIFEGDILEIKGHPFQRHTGEMSGMPVGIDIDGRYVIEYNQENAGYVVGNWKTREVIRYCTVIGNIHEHSHLLESGGHQQ